MGMVKGFLIARLAVEDQKNHAKSVVGSHSGNQYADKPDTGMAIGQC